MLGDEAELELVPQKVCSFKGCNCRCDKCLNGGYDTRLASPQDGEMPPAV